MLLASLKAQCEAVLAHIWEHTCTIVSLASALPGGLAALLGVFELHHSPVCAPYFSTLPQPICLSRSYVISCTHLLTLDQVSQP